MLPYLIKTLGAQAIARGLGRPITIGQVNFDPLRLKLTLINGIVGPLLSAPNDKVDPILSFSKMTINLETSSLFHRAIICQELSIDQPFFHLVQGIDNKYNASSLVPPTATENHRLLTWLISRAAQRYSINNIELTRGEIRYEVLTTNKSHRLEEVTLTLPAIENINYHSGTLQPQFSARINGTPIAMTGQTPLSPQGPTTSRMSLKMANLDLETYKDHLPPQLGLQTLKGQADLDLDVLYDGSQSEKIRVLGEISLRSFQGENPQGKLTIDSGRISGWFAPVSKQFHANAITLAHPVWHRPADKAFPWRHLAAALIQTNPRQLGTMPVTLLQITNGEIFAHPDSPLSPATNWKGLDASINTAHPPDGPEQAFFSLNARTETGSRLSLQGSASGAPFTAKGLMILNTIDIATIQDLWQIIGPSLPITAGTIDQTQTNFAVTLGPNQEPILHLDPLAIQARNILVELNGQTLEVPVWHSDQGSFNPDEPTLHLGKVRLQQAKIVCRRSSATASWQTPLTDPDIQATPPPDIDLKGLEITNSSLVIENQGPPDISLRLERFDLQLDQIDRARPNTVTAAAMLDDKYPVQAAGTFTLAPFNATLNLQTTEVPLTVFQPLFNHYLTVPASGALSVDGTLSLPALNYTGNWSITELASPPISCRKIIGEETVFSLRPLSVAMNRLTLQGPSLQVTANENGMPTLPPLIQPGWQPGTTPDEATVSIKSITLSEGTLIYDFPGPPGLTLTLNKIDGDLSDYIVAKDQIIPFTFTGKMENSAQFEAEGTISPFATQPAMTLATEIIGLPLSSLAAVIEPHWGFTIKDGTLDFENDMTYENTLIHDVSHLTFNGLKLSNPLSSQAIKAIGSTWETLPLIQALLQDTDGAIALTIPIDGRTDTGFTYLEGIKAFLNQLLLKATVSPVSILGNTQKTIPETISFKPGSDQLTPTMKERLPALALYLSEHPLIAIILTGSTDPADQKALLQLNKNTGKGSPSHESLQQLARQRTQAVSDFLTSNGVLTGQIERTTIETTTQKKTARPNRGVAISVTMAK